MKTDVVWKVDTVPGHILEKKLNELAHDQCEIVTVERTGSVWTIITHRSTHEVSKGKVFGFTAQRE